MMRALTKIKAPMQLPITVLTEIGFETAPAADCVAEAEGVIVWTIVMRGGLVVPGVAPESKAKPEVLTVTLGAMTTPETPTVAGKSMGSDLFARYGPSWINMMDIKMMKGEKRLEGGVKEEEAVI